MAGAGIEVSLNAEYNHILAALKRASKPDLKAIGDFVAGELKDVSNTAFEKQADPATGVKWEDTKRRQQGLTDRILWDRGILKDSVEDHGLNDGSAIIGSNLVYARIHQKGGDTGRGHTVRLPPRPYMGVPEDFGARILEDPYIQGLLGRFG
jgi:phage virion morphogenesis protein